MPIPPDEPHAVSVSLPHWQDIVDYEEGRLTDSMKTGYPRFFIHRSIQKLAELMRTKFARPGERTMLFPSSQHASQCRDFISARAAQAEPPQANVSVRIVRLCVMAHSAKEMQTLKSVSVHTPSVSETSMNLYIVLFPQTLFPIAKQFWQHTGVGISSRMADECLRILEHNESLLHPNETGSASASIMSRRGSLPMAGSSQPRGGGFGRSRYSRGNSFGMTSETTPSTSATKLVPEPPADEDDDMTFEQAVFMEERYGRNLPFALSADAKVALRRRIAGTLVGNVEDEPAESAVSARYAKGLTENNVFLYPCGMASIFNAHQLLMLERAWTKQGIPITKESCTSALRAMKDPSFTRLSHGIGKSVCFGFPYTDTLKVLEKWGPGCHFFGHGTDQDVDELEALLAAQPDDEPKIHALFCEFPGNPLLRSADLPRLRALADRYDFSIVIDETIGNFVNVEVLPYADMVVSSLTKVFSGECNVMGGSLVVNPQSKRAQHLLTILSAMYQDNVWVEDAIFLERNSRNFVARIAQIDENTEMIVDMLHAQSRVAGKSESVVQAVYYPKYVTRANYDKCRRTQPYAPGREGPSQGGYGGLFSVEFTSKPAAIAFYDHLQCAKGPSLGTNCTISCPYTLLAHYTELDWAAQLEVSDTLVRVSIGLEEPPALREAFTVALAAATVAATA
ncbi:Cystathionine gamma-synthase [Malassezia pachydermatis]